MKKLILVVLAVGLLFVSGCSTVETALKTGSEREATLNNARLAAKSIDTAERIALANIPACHFKAAPGETLTFGGIEEFSCHGGVFTSGSTGSDIQQRHSRFGDWMMTQGNNIFGFATLCLVFGACGLGGTSALPSTGPSPETILIPTQVLEPQVIFAP